MKHLFIDMDGVLADFVGRYVELYGHRPDEVDDDLLWKNIDAVPDFFPSLAPLEHAVEAFRVLQRYSPEILTACPRTNYNQAAAHKRAWVRAHLGEHAQVITCQGGRNKPVFMRAPGDVLVDDRQRNIEKWEAAGGVGILHEGDWFKTMERVGFAMA